MGWGTRSPDRYAEALALEAPVTAMISRSGTPASPGRIRRR